VVKKLEKILTLEIRGQEVGEASQSGQEAREAFQSCNKRSKSGSVQ